jgi:hypothetical protein
MRLPGGHLRSELAVCCDLVIRGLDLLNEIGNLGIESLVAGMLAGYKSVLGVDPVAETTEG